jgi:hypothetical protein
MIEHMVWMKFKPEVAPDRIEQHLANLRALAGRIPGVLAIKTGTNFTNRSGGYTHGLLVTLADKAALDVYLPHPEHVAAATPLKQDADLLAMDIEV